MATTTQITALPAHTAPGNADLIPVGAGGDSALKKMTLQTLKNYFLNTVYPVGSIYMSANETNPGNLFGGTWEAYAQGRALIGLGGGYTAAEAEVGSASTKITPAGSTSEVKLDVTMLPQHVHQVPAHSHPIGPHTHTLQPTTLKTKESGVHYHTMRGHASWVAQSNSGKAHLFPDYSVSKGVSGSADYPDGKNNGSPMTAAPAHTHDITIETGKVKTSTGTGNTADKAAFDTTAAGRDASAIVGHTHTFTGSQVTVNTVPPSKVVYIWKRTA